MAAPGVMDYNSDTSEEFLLVEKDEGMEETWPTRAPQGRLYGLFSRPFSGRKPAAPKDSAPLPPPPAAIPILSLPPRSGGASYASFSPHLCQGVSPGHSGKQPQPQPPQQPLQLFAMPSGGAGGADGRSELRQAAIAWQQQQLAYTGLPSPPLVAPADDDTSSMCSGISICSSVSEVDQAAAGGSKGGGSFACLPHTRSGSFTCLQPPSQPYLQSSASAASSISSSSGGSSGSDLVNMLMQQAEPAQQEAPPLEAAPMPAAAAVAATAAATAGPTRSPLPAPALQAPAPAPAQEAARAAFTPNPLLQQERAALLSWRRNAWQHSERRQTELLRRLLYHEGSDDEEAGATATPVSPPPANAAGRGRAPGSGGAGALALLAALALAVMLLHLAHSSRLEQRLASQQEQQLLQEVGARAQQAQAAAEAAMLSAATGGSWDAAGADAVSRPVRGMHRKQQPEWQQHQPYAVHEQPLGSAQAAGSSGHLPKLRLRRLTVLLFAHHSKGGATPEALQAGGGGSDEAEEYVFEEWRLSMRRR